jgi:hypothetical protein
VSDESRSNDIDATVVERVSSFDEHPDNKRVKHSYERSRDDT